MSIIDDSLTIAEKETKLALRYKVPFFTSSLVGPVIRIMPFLLVYWGFFAFGENASIGSAVTSENFVVFLILGMLCDVFFDTGWRTFTGSFMTEKYWQTIEAMLLSPINKLSLILGMGLSDLISLFPAILMFTAACFFFMPISLLNLAIVLLCLMLLFSVALSIGLLVGCAALFNENFMPLFSYARVGVVFFSCFYYPITVLDIPFLGAFGKLLPTIAYINPIYQATNVLRTIWLGGAIELNSLLYVVFFAILAPIAAVYIFKRLFKVLSIQGY